MNYKKKSIILLMPHLLGFLFFYVLPFLFSFFYAMTNNVFEKKFVGLANFAAVLKNKYFRLALKNTFIFTAVDVPLLIIISFILSILLIMLGERFKFYRIAFIIPMLLPTAGIVLIWKIFFNDDGYIIKYLLNSGINIFVNTKMIPIYILFLWKNCGYNIILFISGISSIPKEIYEACDLDGASNIKKHIYITCPLLLPTTFFVTVLSLVNSFKIFKEIYLYFGTDYPDNSLYVIQYFMNNNFHKLNYQNLTSGAIIFAIIIYIIIAIGFKIQSKFAKEVW